MRRASAGSPPAGARGCRRRRVPPDRALSGTSAMRPRSATACTSARRRAGRALSARRGAGARRRQAADPGCPSPLRPIRPRACGWPRALRILTSSLCRCQCYPTRPSSRRGGCPSAALRSPSSRTLTGRRSTSTTRRPCEPGHGPTARRSRATPAARGRRTGARRTRPWASCGSCSRRAWGWTWPRRASWHMRSRQAPPESYSSSTATTSRTPMSGPPSPPGRGSWSSTIWGSSTRSSGSLRSSAASSRSCFA